MSSTILLSDNGVSSGSSGYKITAGTDGVLILQSTTSGGTATNAIYVDNSQQVGFGTSTPSAKLTVNYNSSYAGTPATPTTGANIHLIAADGTSASFSADTFGNQAPQITLRRSLGTVSSPSALTANLSIGALTVRGYGATGYSTGNRGFVGIYSSENWSDTAQGTYMIVNTVADGTTTSSESLRVNGAGTVILKGGSTTAAGVGITFPATQSASTDANTLDDYEEGTWTPQFGFNAINSTGVTYAALNAGYYTKVGRQVTVTFVLDVATKGSATGNGVLGNLPFANINNAGARGGIAIGYTAGLTVNNPNIMMDAGTTNTVFRTPNSSDMNQTTFSTAFAVYGSYTYFTS